MDKGNNDYCGIPLNVKSIRGLTKMEKYLFGVISYNATAQGFWMIKSEFLTELFKESAGTIARRIYSLESEGLLSANLIEENDCYIHSFKILFPYL